MLLTQLRKATARRLTGNDLFLAVVVLSVLKAAGAPMAPLRLHPQNPRYFEFQGRPTVLITATEHYGALLNQDFKYVVYLNELQKRGFNLTRVFSGTYRELPGSFGIKENPLAPAPGRFLCPWARSAVPGAADAGNKFDLQQWDVAYFARLKDFLAEAGRRGIVVEYVFFCTFYSEDLWRVSPMNALNNINGIGRVGRHEVYAAGDKELLTVQEAMVRKIVSELKEVPNLYYEICNEPYERPGLTPAWNDRIAAVIAETEAAFPMRHLIAQGIDRNASPISGFNPQVSVFNFHSATPERALRNYSLNRALADDETGGKGVADYPYRREGWTFLLAGGGVFDHLDFSFTCARPDGAHRLSNEPGGGGPALRRQIQVLKEFLESFEFIRLKPETNVVRDLRHLASGSAQQPLRVQALVEPGMAYALYVEGGGPCELSLDLPGGTYRSEWVDPLNGETAKAVTFQHSGGSKAFLSPAFAEDMALRIKASP